MSVQCYVCAAVSLITSLKAFLTMPLMSFILTHERLWLNLKCLLKQFVSDVLSDLTMHSMTCLSAPVLVLSEKACHEFFQIRTAFENAQHSGSSGWRKVLYAKEMCSCFGSLLEGWHVIFPQYQDQLHSVARWNVAKLTASFRHIGLIVDIISKHQKPMLGLWQVCRKCVSYNNTHTHIYIRVQYVHSLPYRDLKHVLQAK